MNTMVVVTVCMRMIVVVVMVVAAAARAVFGVMVVDMAGLQDVKRAAFASAPGARGHGGRAQQAFFDPVRIAHNRQSFFAFAKLFSAF